jgi:rhodanese-related sulfurtransferase
MKSHLLSIALLLMFAGTAFSAQPPDTVAAAVPRAKQTRLGLYVTAKDAYLKYQADPDHVKLLDVRTPEEYTFTGHAADALNIPLMLTTYQWSPGRNTLMMKSNPDFLDQVRRRFKTDDTILIMCRSGGRSAKAVNRLAEAGFKKAYTIVDGFEGDTDKSPDSPTKGKRTVNGWKNAGNPWTYDIRRELMCLPEAE